MIERKPWRILKEGEIRGPFNVPYGWTLHPRTEKYHLAPTEMLEGITIHIPMFERNDPPWAVDDEEEWEGEGGTYILVDRKQELTCAMVLSVCRHVSYKTIPDHFIPYEQIPGSRHKRDHTPYDHLHPLPDGPGLIAPDDACRHCLDKARMWGYFGGRIPFPFPVDEWHPLRSFLILAIGLMGDDLVVRFIKGDQIYRYIGAGKPLYSRLGETVEVGRVFHSEVRSWSPYQKFVNGEWEDRTLMTPKEQAAHARKFLKPRVKRTPYRRVGRHNPDTEYGRKKIMQEDHDAKMEAQSDQRYWTEKEDGLIIPGGPQEDE